MAAKEAAPVARPLALTMPDSVQTDRDHLEPSTLVIAAFGVLALLIAARRKR